MLENGIKNIYYIQGFCKNPTEPSNVPIILIALIM